MAKVIPEEEKNYNKFPGEHVIAVDNVVTIGDKVFHLVHNYQDGFDKEKLEQRYSDIFTKHDYIVGDWGHEQLRLKGFFSTSRKKMPDDLKISHLADYIKEHMNYGAAFFVLKRMRSKDIKREEPFLAEKIYEVPSPVVSKKQAKKGNEKSKKTESEQLQPKQRQGTGFKKRQSTTKAAFVQKDRPEKQRASFTKAADEQASQPKPATKRPAFIVRTRKK